MTAIEQDTELVNFAIQQTTLWLTVSRRADPIFIVGEIFYNVCSQFKEQGRRLRSIEIVEVGDLKFEVCANGHAKGILIVEPKKVAV
jgi:hypothetical protein